ncbi:MAG: hypothetical protein JXM70_10835 [Pirellulales bacterium]|nr:hypothetical protein [Pirellulales bacterium]
MKRKQGNPVVTKEYDVLGMGAVAVDDFLYVEHYPHPDEKVRVCRRERQCGGQTGTALVTVARLGRLAGYIGMLGNCRAGGDELSRAVADCFEREGVDLTHHIDRPDAGVYHSTIIVDQTTHSRTILTHTESMVGADPLFPAEDVIRSTAVLLVDHHGLDGTLRAARIARNAGIPVVGDIERGNPAPGSQNTLSEVIRHIDHLVVPLEFARDCTGLDEAGDAASRLWEDGIRDGVERSAVVVTCGVEGCWYIDDNGLEHFPAFYVEAVDTTGCGDVFHGAYCVALVEGMGLRERVRFASAAAALKATRRGGQTGIPMRKQLNAFLVERKNR